MFYESRAKIVKVVGVSICSQKRVYCDF